MSDENAQVSTEQPAATLDDVINEYYVEPTPAPAEPQTVETPAMPSYVDPLNDDQWRNYQHQQQQITSALQSELKSTTEKLTQYETQQAQDKLNADIKSAVNQIQKKVENADPLMTELYLEKKAIENPKFAQLFQNRDQNPTAWNKALEAVSGELAGKFDMKTDPQLAENHRAATQSQQSSGNTTAQEFNNPNEERLAAAKEKGDAAWQQEWNKIKAGG